VKHFFEYLDIAIIEKSGDAADEIHDQKEIFEASKAHTSYVNALLDLTATVKSVEKTPEALVAMDSLCIIFERDSFAQNEKEREKCNEQLQENMDILNALGAVRNPAQYRRIVRGSGVDNLAQPPRDAFIAIFDKRIRQLGRDSNSINTHTAKKGLYEARKANFSLAKSFYQDLQREALRTLDQ
jgi:hypothetical protein